MDSATLNRWVIRLSYSPYLNPEEYLWNSMKRALSKDFIKTIDEMKAAISYGVE